MQVFTAIITATVTATVGDAGQAVLPTANAGEHAIKKNSYQAIKEHVPILYLVCDLASTSAIHCLVRCFSSFLVSLEFFRWKSSGPMVASTVNCLRSPVKMYKCSGP